jgi:DNA-directed RNA polymerase subunit RPC12/RpoP
MDFEITDECKLCKGYMGQGCFHFPNIKGNIDICENCGDYMKYLEIDLVKDKIKFMRKIRCDNCNFRICKINDKSVCLWCLNDDIILRHKVLYDKYNGKTHAFVLQNDFSYCISQIEFITKYNYDETKLTHLTKKVLNNVSHSNRYTSLSFEDTSINKRWM